jgi:hypothetical protein
MQIKRPRDSQGAYHYGNHTGIASPDMCGGSSLSCRRCGARSPRAGGLALCVPSWTINDWRKVCTSWTEKRMRLLPMDNNHFGLSHVQSPRCSLYACRGSSSRAQWLNYKKKQKRWILPSKRIIRLGSLAEYDPSLGMGRLPQCFSATGLLRSIK